MKTKIEKLSKVKDDNNLLDLGIQRACFSLQKKTKLFLTILSSVFFCSVFLLTPFFIQNNQKAELLEDIVLARSQGIKLLNNTAQAAPRLSNSFKEIEEPRNLSFWQRVTSFFKTLSQRLFVFKKTESNLSKTDTLLPRQPKNQKQGLDIYNNQNSRQALNQEYLDHDSFGSRSNQTPPIADLKPINPPNPSVLSVERFTPATAILPASTLLPIYLSPLDGRVGINTSHPSASLDVKGVVKVEEDLIVVHDTYLNDSLTVQGFSSFLGRVDLKGGIEITDKFLVKPNTGDIESDGTLRIQGQSWFFNDLSINGHVTLSANKVLTLGSQGDTDPSASNGAIYYSTTTNRFRCYQNGVWTDCVAAGGSSGVWSDLNEPTDNLALTMEGYTTTLTFNAATGTENLFTLRDSENNTGTGYLFNLVTDTSSTLNPFHISAAGTEALLVNAQGQVGINTLNPASVLDVNGNLMLSGSTRYLNFSTTAGDSGYGFYDNSGTIQYKDSSGSWINLLSLASLWTDQGSYLYPNNYASWVIGDTAGWTGRCC